MSNYSIQPLSLGAVRTYPLASRKSKVSVRDFAKPSGTNSSLTKCLDSLPDILTGEDLRNLLSAIHIARKQRKAILWGIGGHVIKVGLGPVLIDLMKRGFVSGIAMNGAALIHDFEIALAGNTSEDVEAGIGEGQFGMAEETGQYINEFAKLSHRVRIGYGEAAGQFLSSGIIEVKHADSSVLVAAYMHRIPVTIHLAIGTDIPHMHPATSGAALGGMHVRYVRANGQMNRNRDAVHVRGHENAGIRMLNFDDAAREKLPSGFAVADSNAVRKFGEFVDVLAGFLGHAELAFADAGFDVFGGVASQGDFKIVDEGGTIHGDSGNEAAFH